MDGDGDGGAEPLDVRILGHLEVRRGGLPLTLGGRRQQAVLACLAVSTAAGVPTDRLADALWGEAVPPASLPTLQTYVYHLREVLEPDRAKGRTARVLVTTRAGYRLEVADDHVDARRFERLAAEGQQALASDPARASRLLADGLALWRGDVLPDFVDLEPVAREADRLGELRKAAWEGWATAEVALGHHRTVLPELGRLVAAYPLREGLHAQRMLALYRDGRQAEALAAYRQLRATLDEELGVEPGAAVQELHQRVLRHDPDLEWVTDRTLPVAPSVPGPPRVDAESAGSDLHRSAAREHPRRRRRWPAVVTIVAVALGLLAGTVLRLGSVGAVVAVPANAVAMLSRTGLDGDAVPLPGATVALAEGAGALWALDQARSSLVRIDPHRHEVTQTIPGVGVSPQSLAVAGNDVWVTGYDDGVVTRVNTQTSSVVQRIPVGIQPTAVVATDTQVWVANSGDNTVQRIDPVHGSVGTPIGVGTGPSGLALDGTTLWVANTRGASVTALDTRSGERLTADVAVEAGPRGLTVTPSDVWVADELGQAVSRISRQTGRTTTIPVEDGPSSVVVVGGDAWVSNTSSGSVSRIDTVTNAVTRTGLGSAPRSLAVVEGRVWVSTAAFASADHVGGTLVYTTQGGQSPDSLDPASAYSPEGQTLLRPVYDGLVSFEVAQGLASQTLVPDLATSVPTPSDGGRTYVFTIRPGVRYSTGREVVASDFVRGLRRALTGRGAPDLYKAVNGAAECLKARDDPSRCTLAAGVSADDTTRRLTIRLREPDPDFLSKLTYLVRPTPPGAPPTDTGMSARIPGTGPYQIADLAPDGSFSLIANPYFHQWSFAAQPAGYPDRIQHRVAATPASGIADVLHGTADVIRVPTSEMASLAGHDQLVYRYAIPHTDWAYLNSHLAPFDDLKARQAINYAVDRRSLVKLYGAASAAEPSCQMLPAGFPAYRRYCPYQTGPASGDYLGPDLERARRLVRESATGDVPVTVWAFHGQRHGIPDYDAFPTYLAGVLRSIGYRRVDVKDIPDQRFDPQYPAYRGYQVFTQLGWVADYPGPQNFYAQFSCTSPNLSHYCNRTIERVAEQADATAQPDPGRSLELWSRVDHLLTDDAAFVTLGQRRAYVLVSPRVRNVVLSPLWGPVLSQLWVK